MSLPTKRPDCPLCQAEEEILSSEAVPQIHADFVAQIGSKDQRKSNEERSELQKVLDNDQIIIV